MGRFLSRWWSSAALVAAALVVAGRSSGALGLVLAVLLLGYAWALSPAFFPRSTELGRAVGRAESGAAPVVFWKPGCLYCIRLRAGLGLSGRQVSWVDSSLDEEARALVRSHNGGDHTTPTVVIGDQARTNPDVAWVRSALR